MSASGGGSAVGRREVAVRCFAAEYDDASLEYSETDEERAPNYVVTPTGGRVNRLFAVGVLTEVEQVSDDVLRGRVVDPTGAFVVYAGQYQPDAKTALERMDLPAFVAVTGKARTFEPDDGDRVYTSIRPESINAVDAETRDRWTVQAAEHTVERVATFAAALEREERGAALTEALLESGVDPGLAAGIPRALDYYGTTPAYLAGVRELALQAAAIVAGERDEVEPLDLEPADGGAVDVDLTGGVVVETPAVAVEGAAVTQGGADAGAGGSESASPPSAGAGPTAEGTAGGDEANGTAESRGAGGGAGEESDEDVVEAEPGESAAGAGGEDLGDFDEYGTDDSPVTDEAEDASSVQRDGATEPAASEAGAGGTATDELYEMDDEEREEVEEEFGTAFSTGSEVDGPGEADIETPGAEAEAEAVGDEVSGEDGAEATSGTTETEGDEADDEADAADLVEAAVAAMRELDDGDGAEREAVIEAVAAEHDVEGAAVEDAIRDALMGGRCYEPDDGRLKAI